MKFVLPSFALVLLACSTSSPDESSSNPSSSAGSSAPVGSSAEALRKLGQVGADDVQACREAAARCAAGSDAASNPFCGRIGQHCDDLEAQLAADRADLEQCLEEAAACERSAADPADCALARAACEPADGEFRARRGRTQQCADRAERCLAPGGAGAGFGRRVADADAGFGRRVADADAGAGVCEADDDDFVGCCRGRHGRAGDAGADGFGAGRRGRGGFPGQGFRPDRDRDREDLDAGAPPPRGAPFGRAP